jgi:hypothetical protein
MQKIFIITAFILLSSAGAAAQEAVEQKRSADGKQAEYVRLAESARTITTTGDESDRAVERKQTARIVDGRVLRLGPSSTYLKEGLRTDEVVGLLGKPSNVSERREGNRLITTYTFERSEGRVLIADFANGLLINSRMETAIR